MKYAFDRFVLDPGEFRLTRDGEQVPLPPKPFDLLVALVARAGQLVSRDELLRTVWKDVVVEQSSLNAAMSVLRQALGDEAGALIETVAGRGYRLRPSVSAIQTARQDLPRRSADGAHRVVIVDDHAVVRLGVRSLLERQTGYACVGEAASPAAAIALCAAERPDLLILDLMIDGEPTLPHILACRAAVPGLRVIVLSMHDEDQWARLALTAGAHGYVMKGEMLEELAAAVHAVMAGGVWVSARISRALVQDFLEGRPLSV